MNSLKVAALMATLSVLFVGFGWTVSGQNGAVMALGFAMLMNAGSYWFSDKIVLKMYGARPITPEQAPDLFRMTQHLADRAGIPMPKMYLVDDPQPNAFATGRSPQHAAVAVNQGLLDLLDSTEVEGVIAHELSHVQHRDTLTMAIVATLAGAIMMLANMARWGMVFSGGRDDRDGNPLVLLIGMILAPIAAVMIQCMISQSREFEADAGAARIIGSPRGLINALAKLEQGARTIPTRATPQTAHMFIVNPFSGVAGGIANLFRTHPPTEQRIAALQAIEQSSLGPTFTTK